MSTTAMALSRVPPHEPPKVPGTPEAIVQRAEQLLAQSKLHKLGIVEQLQPGDTTFESIMIPVADRENDIFAERWFFSFLRNVHPDAAFREASSKASIILNAVEWDIPEINERANTINAGGLDSEAKMFLRARTECPSKEVIKDRKTYISERLKVIETDVAAKLVYNNNGFWFSEAELDGLPEEELKGLKEAAEPDQGKILVRFKGKEYFSVLRSVKNPDTRKKLYIANYEMHEDKAELFKEALVLRHEGAVLNGYANHATQNLKENMIDSPDAVKILLENFQKRVTRMGVLQALIEAKRNDSSAEDKTLYLWDEMYYTQKWVEASHLVKEKEFSEYFPVQPTLLRIFAIFEKLFGISFERVEGEFWHKDVELYAVWDDEENGGSFSGYLFLDLYKRLGKTDNSQNYGVTPGYIARDGQRRYAVNAMICQYHSPSPTEPFLMKQADVFTFFHELGHSMHAILSRARYGRYSGTLNAYDFLEVPGLLFENWLRVPEQIKQLSGHYKTGEPMPEAMINDIMRTGRLREKRMLELYQVMFATYDLAIHTPATQKDAEDINPALLWNEMECEIRGLAGTENGDWNHRYVASRHIISSYPGTMIVYIAGFCFAELIWKSLFEKDPTSREAGMHWRREVLEKGGTMMPMDMLENLLGFRPQIEDLCKEDEDTSADGRAGLL